MRTIKHIVSQLIRRHGTNNPFDIADQKNIIVLYEPIGTTLGYFNTYKRIRMIHINDSLCEYGRNFVCAHELGHCMLHPKVNTLFLRQNTFFSVGRIEREANEFAAELLLPDTIFAEDGVTLSEAASAYGVPVEVAALKRIGGVKSNGVY